MIALAEYNQSPYDLKNKKITFDEAYNAWSHKYYEQHQGTNAAILRSVYKICKPLATIPMDDIRLKHLQEVMDSISDKSTGYQTKLKTIYLKTFRYAMENDIIQKNYAQYVTINQTPIKQDIKNKFFTSEEIEKIFANIDWSIQFPVDKHGRADIKLVDSLVIMLYTGIRVGELLNLKLVDVDIVNRMIHVPGTKTAAADRMVPIHKDLVPYLDNKFKTSKEYVIENINGTSITPSAYREYFFTPFMRHINAPHTPHALRHTFISIMDKNGVTAESVVLKRIVGHANRSITEHYTHKGQEELLAAIDKFKL